MSPILLRGVQLEDTVKYVVPALEKAGADCFDVSQGSVTQVPDSVTLPIYHPRGCQIHNAAAVKKVTRLPVIGVGRIVDLDMAERFLLEGKADIIHLGKQLISDPETPRKYFEGRPEDARRCMGCSSGCGRPCAQNYDMQDAPVPLTPAEKPKKVLVIGGGVSGMEAARVATLRGHKVTLMEKQAELGGMVATLALTPLTAEFGNLVDYLSTQLRKLKVDVRACREVTPADVEAIKPDVVILATGSAPTLPEVVKDKPGVMTHDEALRRKREIGNRVVVWGFFGSELAIALAQEGRDVVLMGKGGVNALASDLSPTRRWMILRKLTDMNFARGGLCEPARLTNPSVIYNVEVESITLDGINITTRDKGRRTLPYDTLIMSRRFGERSSNDALHSQLQGNSIEVHKIGDCSQIKGMVEAINSANEVARKI